MTLTRMGPIKIVVELICVDKQKLSTIKHYLMKPLSVFLEPMWYYSEIVTKVTTQT